MPVNSEIALEALTEVEVGATRYGGHFVTRVSISTNPTRLCLGCIDDNPVFPVDLH